MYRSMPGPARMLRASALEFTVLFIIIIITAGDLFAQDVESLQQRELLTVADLSERVCSARSNAYPLRTVDRLPLYGLPYDLVNTTTGRIR